MLVRAAAARDLPLLEATLSAPPGVHASRLARQAEGQGDFLLVFDPLGMPVGSAFLKTSGPWDAGVAKVYPDVPELIHLQVIEAARGQGAGSAVLDAARERARSHGFVAIGLSVGVDNPRARALYERSGFADSGVGCTVTYVDAGGVERRETSVFMTRSTAGPDGQSRAATHRPPR